MTLITDGGVAGQGVGHAIHMQVFSDNGQESIDYIGVALGTIEICRPDMIIMFPEQIRWIVAGIMAGTALRLICAGPDRLVGRISGAEIAVTISVAAFGRTSIL